MNKIAVLDYRLHPEINEQIQALASNKIDFPTERLPEKEWSARIGDADIALITVWGKVDKILLDTCPNLKYVGLCGTSTANIDLDELAQRGIAFSNIISGDKESVAEFFFMQLVALVRGVGQYQWIPGEEHELVGRSIGIIGLGQVGIAMANMALAYKMKVNYFSPHRKPEWENKGLVYMDKNQMISSSEIIAICSSTNEQILDESTFKLMQPGSILIQTSSGSPFSQIDFKEWVSKGDSFAMFDMAAGAANYEAYHDLPNVIFSTKVAGDTYESDERRGVKALENLSKFIEGEQK